MGNIIGSFFSGLFQAIGKLFGSPLDFLAGKSCSSVCGSTWDFICYVENFCVSNLLKMAMVLILCYIVLLFFYLLYKVGLFQCIGRSLCKMVWACIVTWFHFWEYCLTFLCIKLRKLKRTKREYRRGMEELFDSSEDYDDDGSFSLRVSRPMEGKGNTSSLSRQWRDYRGVHLRKSLRPRSHRIQVGISRVAADRSHKRNSGKRGHHHLSTIHNIRVTQTSKFVQKGTSHRGRVYHSRRR